MSERRFPIITGGSIAWERIAPHEEQAKRNHGGQSLEHLASRGGLDPLEAWCVLNDRPWREAQCTPSGMARAAWEVFGPEMRITPTVPTQPDALHTPASQEGES